MELSGAADFERSSIEVIDLRGARVQNASIERRCAKGVAGFSRSTTNGFLADSNGLLDRTDLLVVSAEGSARLSSARDGRIVVVPDR